MAEKIVSITGGKKPVCLYCGEDEHKTQLACPRIKELLISEEGHVAGITFVDDYFDDEPPAAA